MEPAKSQNSQLFVIFREIAKNGPKYSVPLGGELGMKESVYQQARYIIGKNNS